MPKKGRLSRGSDAPEEEVATAPTTTTSEAAAASNPKRWDDFTPKISKRILGAVKDLGWESPTLVQRAVIPLVMESHNVIVHARTGSGKTAAFAIPLLEQLLLSRRASAGTVIRSVILVPSTELVRQTLSVLRALTKYVSSEFTFLEVVPYTPAIAATCWEGTSWDVVVATPAVLYSHVRQDPKAAEAFRRAQHIVMDEADSITSLVSMKGLHEHYPAACQAIMVSATLSNVVQELKQLFLRKPMVVTLEDDDDEDMPDGDVGEDGVTTAAASSTGNISEHYVMVRTDEERFTYLYTLLRAITASAKARKHLIFVANTNSAYKVKLFLESFGIQAFVLHQDIPRESREHILTLFNQSKTGQLIATDEEDLTGFGVRRGLDFVNISHVFMFDCPISTTMECISAYTHRIGRTGRAGRKGTTYLFITPKEADEALSAYQLDCQRRTGGAITPCPTVDFRMVMDFLYRCSDVVNSLTKKKIKKARVKDIAVEMLNCEKLQTHFQKNAKDQSALSHLLETDKKVTQRAPALMAVPFYMSSTDTLPAQMEPMPATSGRTAVNGSSSQANVQKPKRTRSAAKDPIEHLRLKRNKKYK
eukprot:PhM_4_TR17866/c0_g1_i1/m.61720/K14810/DDX56, DBP9; ATP-dependent RNA helicase DDX56/DBP9